MKRAIEIVMAVTFILANSMMIGGFYLYYFQNNPPVEYLNTPFPVDRSPAIYYPGDEVTLYVEYKKQAASPITVQTALVDSYLLPFPAFTTNGAPVTKGTGAILLTFTIPSNFILAENDYYHFEGISIYHVNFLADREVPWKSAEFQIKLRPGQEYRPGIRNNPVTRDAPAHTIPFIQNVSNPILEIKVNPPNNVIKTSSSSAQKSSVASSSQGAVNAVESILEIIVPDAVAPSVTIENGLIPELPSVHIPGVEIKAPEVNLNLPKVQIGR